VPQAEVAIVHPQLRFGGSEACALWGVEALKRDGWLQSPCDGGRIASTR
jgi:hypothetical protein